MGNGLAVLFGECERRGSGSRGRESDADGDFFGVFGERFGKQDMGIPDDDIINELNKSDTPS
jgi:hypothetical protein